MFFKTQYFCSLFTTTLYYSMRIQYFTNDWQFIWEGGATGFPLCPCYRLTSIPPVN